MREAFGLANGRVVPLDPEPGQVVFDFLVKLGAHAGVIDVLEAEEEATAIASREIVSDQGGVGVSEMKTSRRAGRKARGHEGEFKAGRIK